MRCLLVDDSEPFLEAASKLLAAEGLAVAGVASTSAEALARVRELEPDVTIVDLDLGGESGFDLAWQLAARSGSVPTRTILTSTRSEADVAELVAVTPVLGFRTKSELSAEAVCDFLGDRTHGAGCRHEALIYATADEFVAATLPFVQHGLAGGEHVLVVMREEGRAALERVLGEGAAGVEFADAVTWYRTPDHAFQEYTRYLEDRLRHGAPRVRVVAEVIWPQASAKADVAAWKRYEARISGALAAVPVSFICAYNANELPAEIIEDARRTHPVMRTADGSRPSAHYSKPAVFLRDLEGDAPLPAAR